MVRVPALHQQDRGFESRKLELFLGCWTYYQCNPSVWGAEVYTRILRPGEGIWKTLEWEYVPSVLARKLPTLSAVPGGGKQAHSQNPSSSFAGRTSKHTELLTLSDGGVWCWSG